MAEEDSELLSELSDWIREEVRLVEIDPDDDLFAIGLNSISLVRLALEVEVRWGVEIPQVSLFSNPTPRSLAAVISESRSTPD